jgi:SAM-dependent methyltransferase
VLDVGCGIGGAARFVATEFGASVVGVDLTAEYVEAGKELNNMCGGICKENIQLKVGSGTDLSNIFGTDGNLFNKAYFLHVGMNIKEKEMLMVEIAKQLVPGGLLAVYDIMKVGNNNHETLDYPVPWASDQTMDYCCDDQVYRDAATVAGLSLVTERNCHDVAICFFEQMKAARKNATHTNEPHPLGLHILMGEDFPLKMANISGNIIKGRASPYEMIFKKKACSKV